MKQSFIDKHPNFATICSVVVWVVVLAIMWAFTSCKGAQNVVPIHTSDTIHVWHTDTIREIHNDTIKEKVIVTIHDSIIKQTIITNVVNEQGEIIHSEKETNNESFHNSDTNTSFIQHTVDSLLQAKMDSIYKASHDEKPVIVERQKSWWEKFMDAVKKPFVFVGVIVVIVGVMWLVMKLKR